MHSIIVKVVARPNGRYDLNIAGEAAERAVVALGIDREAYEGVSQTVATVYQRAILWKAGQMMVRDAFTPRPSWLRPQTAILPLMCYSCHLRPVAGIGDFCERCQEDD